jgi:hypothetical protein
MSKIDKITISLSVAAIALSAVTLVIILVKW